MRVVYFPNVSSVTYKKVCIHAGAFFLVDTPVEISFSAFLLAVHKDQGLVVYLYFDKWDEKLNLIPMCFGTEPSSG